MTPNTLGGGFADEARDAAFAFRACLDVMARPGRIGTLRGAVPPPPLSVAAGTLLLTLCDAQTPVWLGASIDNPMIRNWIAFHTGAPVTTSKSEAQFALGRWPDLHPIFDFSMGTPEYPDRSATLIVEQDNLAPEGTVLSGPGIREVTHLSLPETDAFQQNAALYPQGLDFYFTARDRIAALPRSTKVEAA